MFIVTVLKKNPNCRTIVKNAKPPVVIETLGPYPSITVYRVFLLTRK